MAARFDRRQGCYSACRYALDGNPIDAKIRQSHEQGWLPTAADRAYVMSLMKPGLSTGKVAEWIAPAKQGINGLGSDCYLVRFTDEPDVRL